MSWSSPPALSRRRRAPASLTRGCRPCRCPASQGSRWLARPSPRSTAGCSWRSTCCWTAWCSVLGDERLTTSASLTSSPFPDPRAEHDPPVAEPVQQVVAFLGFTRGALAHGRRHLDDAEVVRQRTDQQLRRLVLRLSQCHRRGDRRAHSPQSEGGV